MLGISAWLSAQALCRKNNKYPGFHTHILKCQGLTAPPFWMPQACVKTFQVKADLMVVVDYGLKD